MSYDDVKVGDIIGPPFTTTARIYCQVGEFVSLSAHRKGPHDVEVVLTGCDDEVRVASRTILASLSNEDQRAEIESDDYVTRVTTLLGQTDAALSSALADLNHANLKNLALERELGAAQSDIEELNRRLSAVVPSLQTMVEKFVSEESPDDVKRMLSDAAKRLTVSGVLSARPAGCTCEYCTEANNVRS